MRTWRVARAFTVSFLLYVLGLSSGCSSITLSPEVREIERAREAAFAENIDRYEAPTPEGREIVQLLRDHYKKGYETFNLESVQSLLAADFEQRYYWSDQVR